MRVGQEMCGDDHRREQRDKAEPPADDHRRRYDHGEAGDDEDEVPDRLAGRGIPIGRGRRGTEFAYETVEVRGIRFRRLRSR
jgi:hypothetical protein